MSFLSYEKFNLILMQIFVVEDISYWVEFEQKRNKPLDQGFPIIFCLRFPRVLTLRM